MVSFEGHHTLWITSQNGRALEYAKVQTPEICMEAVKQNWRAFKYAEVQTLEICKEAFKHSSYWSPAMVFNLFVGLVVKTIWKTSPKR
jgi:hypothetical protein